MIDIISNNAVETQKIAYELASRLKSGDVLAFFAPMGAGKTTFIKGLAMGLGLGDCVHSPTFTIVHEYRGPVSLFHFDMYRVESFDDLESTAYYDYLAENGIIAIEWSENIENALPERYFKVEIIPIDEEKRHIVVREVRKT
ncbi:MAG TPA: tRNA (adenosine(37)-N6)-threonylcarbamoyltransferase complex ATPase subunit type 1 TsaE [Clostridiales bacterium]|nr:tRNA (adenosine(37)-N6)-threonylcarbamoyltransferase complex ATPase subunit type 1 TsaE [Clostridiales bacterium]